MKNEINTDIPHLDSTALEEALSGVCGLDEADSFLAGLQCYDDACFITTNEFEINRLY